MITLIVVYSVLVALCYTGRQLQSAFYQYSTDLLLLLLSVGIYGGGGLLFYKATRIF